MTTYPLSSSLQKTAFLLGATLAMFLAGCGGSSEPAESNTAPPKPGKVYSEAESEALIDAQAHPGKAKPAAQPTVVHETEDQPSQPAPPKNELPAEFAQWTPKHFRTAKKLRSPRLVQAVRQLGKGNDLNSDAEQNARLLGELLKPLSKSAAAAAEEEEPNSEGAATALPGLAEAIVETLGVNGSDEARGVLKRILLGKQPAEMPDRAITALALRTIVAHPDEENQRILLAVLSAPDSVRPSGRGQVTADQLQEQCLRLVKPIATEDFRLRLAQRVNQGVTSEASRKRLLTMLTAAEPANQSAQVELLAGGQIDPATLPALDRQLSQLSQQVLERALRATPQQWAAESPTASTPTTVVEDAPHDLTFNDAVRKANLLWRADFTKAVAARVDSSDNPQNDAALALLAASLPSEATRAALARRWQKNWVDEAQQVSGSAILSGGSRDPGLLVVLKQLPREGVAPAAKAKSAAKTPAKPVADTPQTQRAAKEQAARQVWLRTSETFVRSLAEQLARSAALQARGTNGAASAAAPIESAEEFDKLLESAPQANTPPSAAKSPESDAPATELGISLPEGARIKTASRLNWPADFRGHADAAQTGPLVVNYLRLASDSDVAAIASFYEKQLKPAFVRTTEKGRWVDALSKLDDGQIRSVDVLITRADAASPALRSGSEKTIVEIVSVEVPDPQQTAAADEVRSASTLDGLK